MTFIFPRSLPAARSPAAPQPAARRCIQLEGVTSPLQQPVVLHYSVALQYFLPSCRVVSGVEGQNLLQFVCGAPPWLPQPEKVFQRRLLWGQSLLWVERKQAVDQVQQRWQALPEVLEVMVVAVLSFAMRFDPFFQCLVQLSLPRFGRGRAPRIGPARFFFQPEPIILLVPALRFRQRCAAEVVDGIHDVHVCASRVPRRLEQRFGQQQLRNDAANTPRINLRCVP